VDRITDTLSPSPWAEDNFDPRPSEEINPDDNALPEKRTAVIRTSDRILFKRCRRRWGWGSHLRGNLGGKGTVSPLWLGSGFHFALEDYYGSNAYGHPSKALEAYAIATYRMGGFDAMPATWAEDLELGKGMLTYYVDYWLRTRDPLPTFIFDGRPQCEVNFRIPIPIDAREYGYDEVVYSGTLDRVAIDDQGILWVLEYKTAKAIQTSHFETDPQVTTYAWAASLLYPGYAVGGVIYQQHLKRTPEQPRMLAGGRLSTDTKQYTDYHAYRNIVKQIYGDTTTAPAPILSTLNHFASLEELESNRFVRRDRLYRNSHQCEAEGVKILLETADMLNPQLDLYPNPTRDCNFCGFKGPCIAIDSGEDWEEELAMFFQPRAAVYDSWRKHLPTLEELN
jgi:hypothetical protein